MQWSTVPVLLLLLSGIAHAGEDAQTIRVTGEATVTSSPDRAELDIAVVTRADTASEAAAVNAREVQRVLASLRRASGRDASLETRSYSLQPDYQYPERGQPKLVGFTATNVIELTLGDLELVGKAIDAATSAGANQVQGIRFTLQNPMPAQRRALRAAARNANANAAALAEELDLDIVEIVSVAETTPAPPRPVYEAAMARRATPVEPGEIETSATVTLTVAVRPRAPVRDPASR